MWPPALRLSLRTAAVCLLMAGLLLSVLAGPGAAQQGATVDVVQIEGPLDGRVAGHIKSALDRAADDSIEALVIELDTEGGLGRDGLELAERIATSPVPVVVWVGPPGARATGAGAVVASSAHVLAVAPAAVLGAAAPPDLRAPDASVEGLGARLGDLAEGAGRDRQFAEGYATGRIAISAGAVIDPDMGEPDPDALPWGHDSGEVHFAEEATLIDGGIVDVAAAELPDVLRGLDGREVAVADGTGGTEARTIDLDPVTAQVRFDNLGLLDRVLHAMADPTLAYFLLVAGLLAIAFEFFQPGFGVAGIAGALVALLGLYGVVVLPVAWWAVLLLLAGLALLAVDLAIAGLGVPSALGTVAFAAGSWWLFDGPPPVQPPVWVLALVTVLVVLFFVVIMTVVLRAQGQQAMAGAEEVVGKTGVVRSMLNPEGHVFVDGALWRARAPDDAGRVSTGTAVRVTGVNPEATSLDIELVEADEPAGR